MRLRRASVFSAALVLLIGASASSVSAQPGGDVLVSVGSPTGPFSSNKQNEPAIAVDRSTRPSWSAGANDNIDMERATPDPTTIVRSPPASASRACTSPPTRGSSWTQPTYSGLSARGCTGVVGDDDPACVPQRGPIGTLPNYSENGTGLRRRPGGGLRPPAGRRRVSATQRRPPVLREPDLCRAWRGPVQGLRGHRGLPHRQPPAAAAGSNAAWSAPVIASKQNAALFADKEQVWADNAATSPHFGNVYVCYAGFQVGARLEPAAVRRSPRATAAPPGPRSRSPRPPTTRTASRVSGEAAARCAPTRTAWCTCSTTVRLDPERAGPGRIQMIRSLDGGATWARPRTSSRSVTDAPISSRRSRGA